MTARRLRRAVLATAAPATALLVLGTGLGAAAALPVPTPGPTSATATSAPLPSPSVASNPVTAPTATPIVPPNPPAPSPTPLPTLPPTPLPTPVPTPTPTPTPLVRPTAVALDHTVGRTANTRTVWLTGTNLDTVSTVLIDGVATPKLIPAGPTRLGFVIGTAPMFRAATAHISLVAAADQAVLPTALTFGWVVENRVDRQMRYAFSNWNQTASTRYGYLPDNDCANFTSQTLRARGWTIGPAWFNKGQGDWSATWVSSTAMSNWLRLRPDLATHLLYRDRDSARVGDIVQFNYEGVGTWWDHTAVVSKVVVLPNGRHDVYYVAHTHNTMYGGSTEYLAHHRTKLRIQFWRLNH